jgi:hypothetical protein
VIYITNTRHDAVALSIRRRISGDLVSADGKPKATPTEDSVGHVNKRNEIVWTLTVKPGEELRLSYRYAFLTAVAYAAPVPAASPYPSSSPFSPPAYQKGK